MRKTVTGNDERVEVCDSGVGDGLGDEEDGQAPVLGVFECFTDLAPSEFLGTGLVRGT